MRMSTMQTVAKVKHSRASAAGKGERPPWWAIQGLKAERVQDELTARLSRRQVEDRLPLLPGWRLVSRGKGLERVWQFSTHEVAASYGSFVSGFASSLGVSVAVSVKGARTVVLLHSTRSEGRKGVLSEGILGFAKLLG